MYREKNPNLEILESVVRQLGSLVDKMVFLGGCATGLLLTDIAAPPIRVTADVDVITEVASLQDYYQLAEQLRAQGFNEDQSPDAPICRWAAAGMLLDVMPTRPEILGFGNTWYQPALDNAVSVTLPSGARVRMIAGPYFLATKLAAFESRGGGDYVASHDMEDIIAVLDGRPEIISEVKQADEVLHKHLSERFTRLLHDVNFVDSLPGHLPGDAASQARLPLVMERIAAIAKDE